jgi:thiol-disulfide isomerase/thioredoxin
MAARPKIDKLKGQFMRMHRVWPALLAALSMVLLGCSKAGGEAAAQGPGADAANEAMAPEFPTDAIWIGTDKPPTMKSLRGQVVIVDFWDYTCINCIRTFPHLKLWYQRYHDAGLQVVGVHKGEFEFAQNADNVRKAYARFALPWPVIADVKDEVWDSFHADAWPQSYLIGRTGHIVTIHTGEGEYGKFEQEIQDALRQGHPELNFAADVIEPDKELFGPGAGEMTQETYVGFERGQAWGGEIGNSEGFQNDKVVDYAPTTARPGHGFWVSGKWLNRGDYFESVAAGAGANGAAGPASPATLGIRYHARDVYVVLERAGAQPAKLLIERDGAAIPAAMRGKDVQVDDKGRTYLLIDEPRMYYAISKEDDGTHDLVLTPAAAGERICSFTFGNKALEDFDRR